MSASPAQPQVTQEDALHAALHSIIERRDVFSPSGLASEVVGAIEAQYPQFEGVLVHIVDGMLCYESGSAPSIMDTLNGFVQQRAHAEAEAADRQVAEEARALPDGVLAQLVHDATRS